MIIHNRQPWLTEWSESVKGTFVNIHSHFLEHLLFGTNSGRRLQSGQNHFPFGNWNMVSFSQDRWNHLYGHFWLSQAIIVSVSPWRQMQNASVESLVVSFEFFGVRTGACFCGNKTCQPIPAWWQCCGSWLPSCLFRSTCPRLVQPVQCSPPFL